MIRLPERPPMPAVEVGTSRRIAELERAPWTAPEFWAEVAASGTPLIEPDSEGHRVVTFLWRRAEDRPVLLMANSLTDRSALETSLLHRVPGTDVLWRSYRLPSDWTGTYQFALIDEFPSEVDREQWRRWMDVALSDPLNPKSLPGRWEAKSRSVLRLPDTADAPHSSAATMGTVTEHRVPCSSGRRRVWVYTPPEQDGPADVAVLLDGDVWAESIPIAPSLDALIHRGTLSPTVVVMPDAVDPRTRWQELCCNDDHLRFLTEDVLPWAREHWWLSESPARTAIAGQSLGGLMAVFAGLCAPNHFGAVVAQSGSFWWHPEGEARGWVLDRMRQPALSPLRVHLEVGTREWILQPWHGPALDALRAAGHHVSGDEVSGGHDYAWWRSHLADGLAKVLAR